MLGGVKFIPRDQIDKAAKGSLSIQGSKSTVDLEKINFHSYNLEHIHRDDGTDALKKERKKLGQKEKKDRKKKRSSRYSSSDEELERVKRSFRKKKWYSSDEYSSSSSSSESESEKSSSDDEKRRRRRKKGKRRDDDNDNSGDEAKGSKKDKRKTKEKKSRGDSAEHDLSEDSGGDDSFKDKEIVRAEMGLEWMLRPGAKMDRGPSVTIENEPAETKNQEIKANPRELNPYLKDNGPGYPEEKGEPKAGSSKLPSSSLVGDGGASWRLKALKRAKEQAARDGKRIEEVVEQRWGSLGQLAASVSSHKAAPSRAHLHAINNRKRGLTEESEAGSESQHKKNMEKGPSRDYLKDISLKLPKMREPKVKDSLSWRKHKSQNVSTQDADLISEAVSSLNKFSNDGSFMQEVLEKQDNKSDDPAREILDSEIEISAVVKDTSLSANQLAAKALQLRMKGKHEEADKLLQEVENLRAKQDSGDNVLRPRKVESSNRHVIQDMSLRRKKNEDDADRHLAQQIMQNKQYSSSTYGQADDEYDFDGAPSRKTRKKRPDNDQAAQRNTVGNRFSIKQEDCIFCYENRRRPAHLVVAVANFTYLMLPQWEPVAPGHCCILPMQHVPSTRSVDDFVWEEIRNFKKCLIMMFGEQEKDVVFLETVMGLAKQRRHCMVECIPLPRELAEEAPHYFKMEIEEAESEWSQHNAKKLIDTSIKGLRRSFPENLPYFHVEFGLKKGFLHPIDDEIQFKSNFGLNIIRGILKAPEEDMHRHRNRRYASTEEQKQAVKSFARDWARFDWTKQLREES